MKFGSWKKDLDSVFPELVRVALGRNSVRTLVLSDRIAFGLPKDRKLAAEVLRLYRPMKLVPRVLVLMIQWSLGIVGPLFLRFRPSHSGKAEISWLANEHSIGFLGCNPGHGVRCVLLSKGKGLMKVTKLSLGSNLEPVVMEGDFLKGILGEYSGVPQILGCEKGAGWAAFCTGHLPGRGPRSMDGEGVIELLRGWLQPALVRLGDVEWLQPFLVELPGGIGEKLGKKFVREALQHGDFTPWNLRRAESGLIAIDWEWARKDGIGGFDLGHGLVMEALLVKGLRGVKLVDEVLLIASGKEQSGYLKECHWEDLNLWLALVFLYSSKISGLEAVNELNVLANRLAQAASA